MFFCGVIRPLVITISVVAMLSIVAPGVFAALWPYLAAAGVLLVPVMVYRWWDSRYNPGCSVRFKPQPGPAEEEGKTA